MFTLGQKVEITGRFEKVFVNPTAVDKTEVAIKNGAIAFSRKYDTVKFDTPKTGIVVGKRSVASHRKHFLEDDSIHTITKRCTAYLVACDLRGMYMVPAEYITSK